MSENGNKPETVATSLADLGKAVKENGVELAETPKKKLSIELAGKQYTIDGIWEELKKNDAPALNAMDETEAKAHGFDADKLRKFQSKYIELRKLLHETDKWEKQGKEIFSGRSEKIKQTLENLFVSARELKTTPTSHPTSFDVPKSDTESLPVPTKKILLSNLKNHAEVREHPASSYVTPETNSILELSNNEPITTDGLDQILNVKDKEMGRALLRKALTKGLEESLGGMSMATARSLEKKGILNGPSAAATLLKNIKNDLKPDREHHRDAIIRDINEYRNLLRTLLVAVEALPESVRETILEKQTNRKETVLPMDKVWAGRKQATPKIEGEAPFDIQIEKTATEPLETPEARALARVILEEFNNRVREARRGNPAAMVNAPSKEYFSLYNETKKLLERPDSEKFDPETKDTIIANFEKLDEMSAEIAEYLSGKTSAVATPAGEQKPVTEAEKNARKMADAASMVRKMMEPKAAPQASKKVEETEEEKKKERVRINAAFQAANPDVALINLDPDALEKRTAFREQWLHKSEGAGEEYKKTKGDVQQMLEGYYTKDLCRMVGSKARAMFGLKPKGLDKERQGKLDAADAAAGAYAASLRERYIARLDRRGIVSGARETAIAQFDALCANRFVIQSGTMLHEAQSGTLSGKQDGAWKRSVEWYGGLSKTRKIALGTAMTLGAGVLFATGGALAAGASVVAGVSTVASVGTGARIGWKAIMIGTGVGALIGRTINRNVTKGARANVSTTARDIQETYTPEVRSIQREELMNSLRRRDRASTAGNVAGMAAGAFVGGAMVPTVEAFAESSLPHLEPARPHLPETKSESPNLNEVKKELEDIQRKQRENTAPEVRPTTPISKVDSSFGEPGDIKKELENIPRTPKEITARLPEDGSGPRVDRTPEMRTTTPSTEQIEDTKHADGADGTEILDADWYSVQKGDTLWDITHKNISDILPEPEAEKFLEYLYNHGTGAMRGDSAEAVALRERVSWDRTDNNIDHIHYGGDGHNPTNVNINGLRELAKDWASHKLGSNAPTPSPNGEMLPSGAVPGSHLDAEVAKNHTGTKTYGERVEELARKTVEGQPQLLSGAENNLLNADKKIFRMMMDHETPSMNVEDRRGEGIVIESKTIDEKAGSLSPQTPDTAEPAPTSIETSNINRDASAPSTESILTPEARVAGTLAGAASYKTPERGVSLEVTKKEIKAEKKAILRAFGEQPPRFFNFGPTDGPYAALKKMTVAEVEKVLMGPQSEYMRFSREAGLQNDRTNKLPLWAEYFKIWRALPIPENETEAQNSNMKFDKYLDGIAKHSIVAGRHASK